MRGLEEERLAKAEWGECSKGMQLGRLHLVFAAPARWSAGRALVLNTDPGFP